jgi:hypothetical protein
MLNPRDLRRILRPNRTSCTKVSSHAPVRTARTCSLTCSTPPNSMRAARRAASGVIPFAAFCSVFVSRWNFSHRLVEENNLTRNISLLLPSDTSSLDPEMEYLADGITESTIDDLSKSPDLKVISLVPSCIIGTASSALRKSAVNSESGGS